ncbi:cell surface protein [Streptomyces sp. NPDC005963]|uniref:cell surface protein n=1 Tax=Streptomyces sp. NPDC005963 TaxID=3156721 RepID=UPI0033E587F9
MHHRSGTPARPRAYTAILLALSVLVSLLLPAAAGWAADGTVGLGATPAGSSSTLPSPSPSSSRVDPSRLPSDVDPARGPEAEPAAGDEQQDRKRDGADEEDTARSKGSRALARAAAAGAPNAADCSALPLAPFGDPGSALRKVTVPSEGSSCFVFTAEQAGPHHTPLESPGSSGSGYVQVFDGQDQLACELAICDLPRTGAFTLRIVNDTWDAIEYHVSVVPLGVGTPGCLPTVGTSLGAPPISGSSPSPLAMICQPFNAQPGERILSELKPERHGSGRSWISDSSGAIICPANQDDFGTCVLPGTGPYRLIGQIGRAEGGFPAAYTLRIHRLSDPEGCQTVPVNRYGSAPTASAPGVHCKTFTVPVTRQYDAFSVGEGYRYRQTVRDNTGAIVCPAYEGVSCELKSGTTYVLHTGDATLLLDRASGAGCETVPPGSHRGTLAHGATNCLELPFAQGASIALPQSFGAQDVPTESVVRDASGKELCGWESLAKGFCKLTGTGPFRAHVTGHSDDRRAGPYSLSLIRTDDPAGCRVLPAGDFTAQSPSVSLTTGGGSFAECLAIPASDRGSVETLQIRTVTGSSRNTDVYVVNSDGRVVCSLEGHEGGTWITCKLRSGGAHTVLFAGVDKPAAYTLARRDVTSGAKGCTSTPAVPVGGPSSAGKPAPAGSMTCHRVTTASAKDALHLNVRDVHKALFFAVFNASGVPANCWWERACGANGSTAYQVIVSALPGKQLPASYRFDALRIRTGSTPAPECSRAPNVTYGYGPISGVLNEQRTAQCVALPTATRDEFAVAFDDTAGGAATAVPSLYNDSLSNLCGLSWDGAYYCASGSGPHGTSQPTVLVVGLPETASATSYRLRLDCTSPWCGTQKYTVTGATPTTGASGSTVTLKVSGSALHEKDRIRIRSGARRIDSSAVSVTTSRTTLTVRLDLASAATGVWSMGVIPHGGQERPLGSFTVTPAVLKNTKAPTVGGTAKVGVKLTAQPGTWTPVPTSYGYQWKADGKDVPKATGSTFTVPASLLGKKVSVTVTARRTGHPSGTATSTTTTVARGSAPKATQSPTVSGTARVGKRLTAKPGTWTPVPTSYGYQWYANGSAISGATRSTLDLTSAQAGKKITVKVTARRTGHTDGTAVSKPTSSVTR